MTPIALLALLGIALLIPVFSDTDDDNTLDDDPPAPVDPVVETPEEPEEPLAPATATLDAATNVVTVTTDPDETGTIYTVANRVDAVNGDGDSNFIYESSVLLVPEGVDLSAEIDTALETGDSVYYYNILSELGVTELGFWSFDPTAAEADEDAIPDFEYPAEATTEFAQIYSTNFGDGGQIDRVVDVDSEENLTEGLVNFGPDATLTLLENNSGAVFTLPTDFDGEVAVFETTTDYFFEDQLVRTDVAIRVAAVDAGTDFASSVLTLADQVTETATSEGALYTINDGSLTQTEFVDQVPGVTDQGGDGLSITEYDTAGNVVTLRTSSGLGISSNVDIVRYEVRTTGAAMPLNNEDDLWTPESDSIVVTSFGEIENIPADLGDAATT